MTMHALLHTPYFQRHDPVTAAIDEEFSGEIKAGCQVLFVPSINPRRSVIGYVVDVTQNPESRPEGIVTDILNGGTPVLTRVTLALSSWMAGYYMTRPIETIQAILPAPLKLKVSETIHLTEFQLLNADQKKVVSTRLRKTIMMQLQSGKKITVKQLEKRLGKKNLYRTLIAMEKGGLISLKKSFNALKPKTRTAYRLSTSLPDPLRSSLSRAPKQAAAIRNLSELNASWAFPEQIGATSSIVKELVKKGYFEPVTVETETGFSDDIGEAAKSIEHLSADQQLALDTLLAGFRKGVFGTYLLHGVTGSGKTILYIELLKEVLAAGKNAIVLVPEISLTPQTASRFRQHFGNDIQILHSAMSNQEKYDAWQKLRHSKARIALGARSTVFAPLENIGAIIVDEEHDTAYKQDRTPRYHGRDTAVMRAKLEGAMCVLGSATPSFESYRNALTGKYHLLKLPERVDGAKMPEIKLIPMRNNSKVSFSISEILFQQIRQRMERDEQVILLQNRRGFAGSILCLDCGRIPACSYCNIPMVYHAANKQLRCHYCGKTTIFNDQCDNCSSNNILYKSSGTERIEDELRKLFPEEKILRMDVDTTGIKGAHAMILNEFRLRKSRILLGTQMVAKGLDFPDVSLVGVLMADIGLNIPDFRAGERLFSLLLQVAGRAGRSKLPGEVFLQAYNTDNDVFRYLLQGSYENYFNHDLQTRKALLYPPFTKLVSCEFSSPDEHTAEKAAATFADALKPYAAGDSCIVLGPAPAVISRIRGRHRFQILLKLPGKKISSALLADLKDRILKKFSRNVLSVTIDVDPQTMI